MMELQFDKTDIVVLIIVCLVTLAYFTKGSLWAVDRSLERKTTVVNGNSAARSRRTRNIIEKLQHTNKKAVVFYGSQTGTAEDFANRLAKEAQSRFGLASMTADLEDYDYENLDVFPADKIAMFVLATYGEGEPTDNAVEFSEYISDESVSFSEDSSDAPLQNLRFVAFGLGNTTYEKYNEMVRKVVHALASLGAKQIGNVGEGDDGSGTMEEDFLAWKEEMWKGVSKEMNLTERENVYDPSLAVVEDASLTMEDNRVYVGEPNKQHLSGAKGPYNAHNPFIAPISSSSELFTIPHRNCIHMEVNFKGSGMTYTTGDHLAVWPTNAGVEVDRFLRVFGLRERRHTVVNVKALDITAKVPFPTPTTYDAIARFYLEICAPVSRQFLGTLAPFAPTSAAQEQLARLGSDKEAFQKEIVGRMHNIAQVLEHTAGGEAWSKVPFSLLVETINHIVPRYYSISSSSLKSNTTASITAIVESIPTANGEYVLKGVATNYILALKQRQHGVSEPEPHGLSYAINGPRNRYDGIHLPIHIRHSTFKMPSDPSKPMILVGPGTGCAPMRGFVQERALLKQRGEHVGKIVFFFGCRHPDEDFLYRKDWAEFKEILGDDFELITAFSRVGPQKVYVHHRLTEHGKEVNSLLLQGGYFYVCGNASRMARDVNNTLGKILAKERGLSEERGSEIVKNMRSSNLYQEDCW